WIFAASPRWRWRSARPFPHPPDSAGMRLALYRNRPRQLRLSSRVRREDSFPSLPIAALCLARALEFRREATQRQARAEVPERSEAVGRDRRRAATGKDRRRAVRSLLDTRRWNVALRSPSGVPGICRALWFVPIRCRRKRPLRKTKAPGNGERR